MVCSTSLGPPTLSILTTKSNCRSFYILETVPTLLIFSSSRSSPKSVGFSTCFSAIRSLSWISICRGGPYRHSLNWDESIMPKNEHISELKSRVKIFRVKLKKIIRIMGHGQHHLKFKQGYSWSTIHRMVVQSPLLFNSAWTPHWPVRTTLMSSQYTFCPCGRPTLVWIGKLKNWYWIYVGKHLKRKQH